jgi:hypothetical protein
MSKVTFKNLNQNTKGSYFVKLGGGVLLTDGNLNPLKMTAPQYNKFVRASVKRTRSQGLLNFKSEVTAKLNDKNLWIHSHAVI